jgi:hypothetical protein
MDEICVWMSVEWMRLLCMIMRICVIFQFKTGVKLKWGCVEPLEQINFWRLGKKSLKIGQYYFQRLGKNCQK